MPRIPQEGLIPRADRLLIQTFPKVAKQLENKRDDWDKAELDAFLKLLPGAVERFQAVAVPTNDLHQSVETAIIQLVASFGPQNSSSRNGWSVDPAPHVGTSNMLSETDETDELVGEPELPNGSDTDQSVASSALSRNDLAAPAGNSGEPDSPQAGPRNPRVRTRSKLSGRAAKRRALQASGESADDRGRLSESEGGPNAKG